MPLGFYVAGLAWLSMPLASMLLDWHGFGLLCFSIGMAMPLGLYVAGLAWLWASMLLDLHGFDCMGSL
eukprot:2689060-Amphidinium_carterae.1